MQRHEIIQEVSNSLIIYLKAGKVGINSFIKKANLNISQLDQLLMIHFLLQHDVKKFVRELPYLIRRFKTSTIITNEISHGEVRGQIQWSNTLKERIRGYPGDRTIFSCNEAIKNYDITENLILKELLKTIYDILFHKIDTDQLENYQYFKDWKELKNIVSNIHTKNIYLSRINSSRKKITNRMIQKSLKHRNPLYSQAAKLLLKYREIMKGQYDNDLVEDLLRETFIYPEKEDVLFELYWTLKIIQSSTENAQLQIIDGRNNLVASWENNKYNFYIYHDSNGSSNISFNIPIEEVMTVDHPYIQKKVTSMRQALNIANESFERSFDNKTFWSGRPDIIVEVYTKTTGDLVKVIIGEVKDTDRTQYAITGLRELLDYMELVKDKNGNYLKDKEVQLIEGRLFIGNINYQDTNHNQVKIHSLSNLNVDCLDVSL